jgi:hypothetical protein
MIPNANPPSVNDTILGGNSASNDLGTMRRMIEERWKLYYPAVDYYPLAKAVTSVGQQTTELVGEAGTTQFDPLWNEAVDQSIKPVGWKQPHLSEQVTQDPVNNPAANAADPEIREGPFRLHMRTQKYLHEKMLKKLGFDQIRTLLCTVPSSMFDRYAIAPTAGDRFIWNDNWYEVLQVVPSIYYLNSTVSLYQILNVQSAKRGS